MIASRVRGARHGINDESTDEDHGEEEPLLGNMGATEIGLSTQTLVSSGGPAPARLKLFIAAISATLGGLFMGATLGWASPAGPMLINGAYPFEADDLDVSWIGSLVPLGCIVGSMISGSASDYLGRRRYMLFLVIPAVIGWALIIWAQNAPMMMVGRFVLGLPTGSVCVVCPLYTAEISTVNYRGMLGSFFQLQVTIGILLSYIFGSFLTLFWLSVVCGILPIIFGLCMFFMPESPYYFLGKEEREKAAEALQWLRGDFYPIEFELNEIQRGIDEMNQNKVSLFQAFTSKAAKKGLIIALGVMFFQQFCGINAVIFYTTLIFDKAKVQLSPSLSTIIVGAMSVIATYISTQIIDRLGRKPLLLSSAAIMVISSIALGTFFFLMTHGHDVTSLGWLPVSSLSLFNIFFSIGFGPIPWMFMGEIFPPNIKGPASSVASTFNWSCTFLITLGFAPVSKSLGTDVVFWGFGGISVIAVIFITFLLPETKGKTIDEIQAILGS